MKFAKNNNRQIFEFPDDKKMDFNFHEIMKEWMGFNQKYLKISFTSNSS